ncbi:glycosyl hydrolase family protein [Bacillus sp. HMF5848]|uniref:family 1 glycosylhydrolase n=1 Tax=Bacillus sp. HMF5848 TaxID=2495421 RepID=UPI000F78006A|nr:glycosyl hydrolase family protein [Bacillus sp. HMF5848]
MGISLGVLYYFEWAEGYSERFGIVFIKYRMLERIKIDSLYWYKQLNRNKWLKV